MEHAQLEPGTVRYAVAPLVDIDVRDPSGNSDDTWTMSGYAAVFGQKTTLYDGKFLKITETLAPGAFDAVLRNQPLTQPDGVVHFNRGHDPNTAVAATDVPAGQPGALTLAADSHGLNFLARTHKQDPDAVALAVKLGTRVVAQASFAFTVAKAEWTDIETDDGADESHRLVTEIGHLYDVCACPQGAYPQTVSQLRAMAAAIGQPGLEELLLERAATLVNQPGGESPVSPHGGGGSRKRLSSDLMRAIQAHRPATARP